MKLPNIPSLLALLPIAMAPCFGAVGVVDSFSGDGLGEYTLSRIQDDNSASNAEFVENGGRFYVKYTGANALEQALFLRDDVGLEVGQVLSVETSFPNNNMGYDLGLVVASTATPVALSSGSAGNVRDNASNDWVAISLRPNQNAVRLNRTFGTSYISAGIGEVGAVNEDTVASLFIERVSQYEFKLGYTTPAGVVRVLNTFTAPEGSPIGGAIGFYADVRSNGTLIGGMDNLRISTVPEASDRGTVIMISSVGPWILLLLPALAWSGPFSARRRRPAALASRAADESSGPGGPG